MSAMGPLESNLSVGEVLAVLRRQRGKMAAFFVAVLALVVVGTAMSETRYVSTSKLFVRLGRENVALDPAATMGQGMMMAVPASREDEINSVVEMLNSRVFAERLVDAFGPSALLGTAASSNRRLAQPADGSAAPVALGPPTAAERERARVAWAHGSGGLAPSGLRVAGLPVGVGEPGAGWGWLARLSPLTSLSDHERAIAKVRRRLSVSAPDKSMVITVSYEARSPEFARAVVTKLVDLFLEDHVRLNRTEGSRAFFESQTAAIKARLGEAERRLRDLKDQTGVTSVADQRRIQVERIGGLQDQALAAEAALAVAVSEVQAIATRLRDLPEMLVTERARGLANEAVDGMRQQLYLLQLREQELLSKYTESMPAVQEIRRQIGEAQRILNREQADRVQVTSGRNPAYEALHLAMLNAQSTVAAQRARLASVRRQLAETTGGLRSLNDGEMLIEQAERELSLQAESYRKYSVNLEEVRIDDALETERISNINIAQPATLEEKPTHPRKMQNYTFGLLLASFGSLGLAFVTDYVERYRA
jgi:uncharacterized protein involved in exopolysaccharide biosynthesis